MRTLLVGQKFENGFGCDLEMWYFDQETGEVKIKAAMSSSMDDVVGKTVIPKHEAEGRLMKWRNELEVGKAQAKLPFGGRDGVD